MLLPLLDVTTGAAAPATAVEEEDWAVARLAAAARIAKVVNCIV
jgi:hypothetical protein